MTIEAVLAELVGKHLIDVEYRLHCMDLQTRLRKMGDEDFGPPDGSKRLDRVSLIATRQGKVVAYEIG